VVEDVALGVTSATIVGLPAAPFTAAEGCLAGGSVVAVTAIPLTVFGAAIDFGLTLFGH